MRIVQFCLICLFPIFLLACAATSSTGYTKPITLKEQSELEEGKRLFEDGYYKRSMRFLLPLACENIPEAEYAIGYMYYYGYGVTQDMDVGYFWIKRAADEGYISAQKALPIISYDNKEKLHAKDKIE